MRIWVESVMLREIVVRFIQGDLLRQGARILRIQLLLSLLVPEFPQGADDFCRGDGIGVVGDQTQQEGSVLLQVVVQEQVVELLVLLGPYDLVAQLEVIEDEFAAVTLHQEANQPDQEAEDADDSHEDNPEPQEHVDLLVVEVQG